MMGVLCGVSGSWALCKNGLQMCELQMLYTYVTFRCLFETQVLCGVSGSWALCKNGLQMCELQMLYTYVTFRCLFETQVLCSVSGSWALCKNGLQMAVAKNTDPHSLPHHFEIMHRHKVDIP
jgi:hypothetical protein